MAHICLKEEQQWFIDNGMGQYLSQPRDTTIDASPHLIPLRADIHWLWDQLGFYFVPKFSGLVPTS